MIEKSIFKDGANKNLTHPKNQRGITLIALVITIIVLLILAGVTINMVLGDDGIIGQAQAARQAQEGAAEEENTKIAEGELEIHFTRKKQDGENVNILFNNGYLTNVATVSYEGIEIKTVDEILDNLPEGYSIEKLTSEGNVQTGSTIMNTNGKKVGYVIIYGDIKENGKISASDEQRLVTRLLYQEVKDLEPYQIIAMDINNDERVDENDITTMNNFMSDFQNINIEQNRKALDLNDITVETRKDKIDEYMKKVPSTFEKEWYVENDRIKYYKVKLEGAKIAASTLKTDQVKIYDATGTEITSGDVGAGSYIEVLYYNNYSKCVVFE